MGSPVLARTLAALAAVAITLALVAGYVRHAAVNSDQFANRATVALRNDSVRTLIAGKITDEVVLKHQSDLIAARPIIQSLTSSLIGSRAFTKLFRTGVRDVHRAVFDRDRDTMTLAVADVGTVLAAALEQVKPSLAKDADTTGRVEILKRDLGNTGGDLTRLADKVRALALILAVLSVALAAGALVVSPDRRATVVHLGVGVAAGGVVVVIAYAILRSLAVNHVDSPDGRAAAGAVWDALLQDLRTAAWVLAGSGAVVAAAAASLLRPIDVREPLRRTAAALTRQPARPALRVLRGLGLIALGLMVLLYPGAVVQLLVTLVGVYLVSPAATFPPTLSITPLQSPSLPASASELEF